MVDIANVRHEIAEAAQLLNAIDRAIITMIDTEVLVGAAPVRLTRQDAARNASEESGVKETTRM
jgi:hypothetical protein